MARVIVSAGHTHDEPGAVVEDLREVDLTKKIANKITAELRNNGIITLSVPPELDLLSRIDWINKTGYSEETEDICIEIHINDGGKSGIEGWYKGNEDNASKKLTKEIVTAACAETLLTNQGVNSEIQHPLQSLAFLNKIKPTSSLIECLYIDNPADQAFLRDESKLDQLAKGIVKGIKNFFGITDTPAKSPSKNFDTPYLNDSLDTGLPTSPPYSSQTPRMPSPRSTGSFGTANTPWGAGKTLSREDRKKMIEEKYQQILGRKVEDQDLNYFLNLGLSEDQMIKRLVESQEHVDIVNESQEYKNIKPEYDTLKIDKQRLSAQLSDKDEIIKKQNELIDQKNRSIHNLQQGRTGVAQEENTPNPPVGIQISQSDSIQTQQHLPYTVDQTPRKENFIDKVLQKLNDIFD
ncbi:MAG: N-acetylmuramoyl-L-alanine amidase [Candidatus Dojkabacteria bacterium]|nr:N-acetylmuramoyl-L-alanine amidase [Candidatus Dojkabacteria bacterium]